MAIKDNVLYVDSYTDLVAFDISNPLSAKEIGRKTNVFNYGLVDGVSWYYDPYSKIITDYEIKIVTETINTNCGENSTVWPVYRGGVYYESAKTFQPATVPQGQMAPPELVDLWQDLQFLTNTFMQPLNLTC